MDFVKNLEAYARELDGLLAAANKKLRDAVQAQSAAGEAIKAAHDERHRIITLQGHVNALYAALQPDNVTIVEDPVTIDRIAAAARALAS
jgi:hypothetical protein